MIGINRLGRRIGRMANGRVGNAIAGSGALGAKGATRHSFSNPALGTNFATSIISNKGYTRMGLGAVGAAGVGFNMLNPSESRNTAASRANQGSYVLRNIRRHSASGANQNLQTYARSLGGYA